MARAERWRQGRNRPHPVGGADAHRHRLAQGWLQQSLRLFHRSHQQQLAPRPGGLSAAADADGRRALCDGLAQGVRGARADGGGARRGTGTGALRQAAEQGGIPDLTAAISGAGDRRAGCALDSGGSRVERIVREARAHRWIRSRDCGGPAPGGGAHDAAREVHPERSRPDAGS